MREIKFKAKTFATEKEPDGIWVHGYAYKDEDGKSYILYDFPGGFGPGRMKINEVLPETICQFTGLKDQNGVEVYECDTIDITTEIDVSRRFGECIMKQQSIVCFVVWNQKTAGFDLETIKPDEFLKDYDVYSLSLDDTDFWVIGNIHDK